MAVEQRITAAPAPGLLRRAIPYVQVAGQLAFAAALLGLLLWRIDLAQVRREMQGVDLWWLAPAFIFNIVSDGFRAVRWREFFRPMRPLSVPFLWALAVLGVACNLALPLRAGEFVRLQVLRSRTGLRFSEILATILSEKLADTVAFSAFLAVGIVLYGEARFLWPLAALYVLLLTAGVAGARWLARRSDREAALLPQHEGRWRARLDRQAQSFGAGLKAFMSTRSLAIVALTSIAAWLCEAILYYSCGRALGISLDPAVYLLIVVAATVAVSVPFTLAGLGVFELALTGLLVSFGVSESEAVAFAIFSHVMLAVPYFVCGPFAAFALRVNTRDILFLRSPSALQAEAAAE